MIFLLLKVTTILTIAQLCLPLMRRATASMRHMICAIALGASLLLPFVPKIAPAEIPVRVPEIATFSVTTGATQAAPWSLPSILLTLWCAGALLLLARTCLGYLRLRYVLRSATPTATINEVRIVAADVNTPFVSGLRKPLIALPLAWPAEFREAAIRHELAHVQRKDLWTELLSRFACAAYWFHPLVWTTAARLRYEREAACDDAVLHSGFDAPSYAEALVAAARRTAKTPLLGCSMAQTTSLKSRTARLLDSTLPRMSNPSALFRGAFACAAVCAAIGVLTPATAQMAVKTVAGATRPPVLLAQNTASEATPAAPSEPAPQPTPANVAEPAAPRIYTMEDGISAPGILSKVDPIYPEEAKDQKISGSVLLELVVNAEGSPTDIRVARSLSDALDAAAVAAVMQWHFAPGRLDDQPVAVRAKVQVNFQLL